VDKRDAACVRESSGHAHHVLLGDTHVNHTVREPGFKFRGMVSLRRVVDDDANPAVILRERQQRR
jgi:hypothetical protein